MGKLKCDDTLLVISSYLWVRLRVRTCLAIVANRWRPHSVSCPRSERQYSRDGMLVHGRFKVLSSAINSTLKSHFMSVFAHLVAGNKLYVAFSSTVCMFVCMCGFHIRNGNTVCHIKDADKAINTSLSHSINYPVCGKSIILYVFFTVVTELLVCTFCLKYQYLIPVALTD